MQNWKNATAQCARRRHLSEETGWQHQDWFDTTFDSSGGEGTPHPSPNSAQLVDKWPDMSASDFLRHIH